MTTQLNDLERIEDELTQVQQQFTAAATTLDALHTIQVQFADLRQTYDDLQRMLSTIALDWQGRAAEAQTALTRLGETEVAMQQLVSKLDDRVQAHLAESADQIRQMVSNVQAQRESLQQQQTALAQTLQQDVAAQFDDQRTTVALALRTMDEQAAARVQTVQTQLTAFDDQIRQMVANVQQQQQAFQQQQATLAQTLKQDLTAQFDDQRNKVALALRTMDEQAASRVQTVQTQLTAFDAQIRQMAASVQQQQQAFQQQQATLAQTLRQDVAAQCDDQRTTVTLALRTMDKQAASRVQTVQTELTALATLQQQEHQQSQEHEEHVQQQLTNLDNLQRTDREALGRTLEALYRRINGQHTQVITELRQDLLTSFQQRAEQTEQQLTALDGRVLVHRQAGERGLQQYATDAGQRMETFEQRLAQGDALLQRNRQVVTNLVIAVIVLALLLVGLGMWVIFSVKG